MDLELTYHQDPGHGWIFADNATLASLGLNSGSFSRYSYKDDTGVYAEEDRDAGVLIGAMKAQEVNFTLKEVHQNRDHWIRNLANC